MRFREVRIIMRIQHIVGQNMSFSSLVRMTNYIDVNGVKRSTQNSTSFRDDLNYKVLARIIKKQFKDCKKINILPMNGSDGTEAYCIGNEIIEEFGLNRAKKKIFPINVTDVDPYIIENFGKKGVVAFSDNDIDGFGFCNVLDYFDPIEESKLPKDVTYHMETCNPLKVKPKFRNLFNFSVMDFQERLKTIKDSGNSVVIIRNCLAQSFGEDSCRVIEQVASVLKNGSLFVIGGYDRQELASMDIWMKFNDFHEIHKNIFQKGKPVVKKQPINLFQKIKYYLFG